jgi:hypothetical protein
MRARVSVSETTTPLAAPSWAPEVVIDPTVDPWAVKDSPALRRLVSVGLLLGLLWAVYSLAPWVGKLFPSADQVLHQEIVAARNPEPAPEPLVLRAQPAKSPSVGDSGFALLPDGQRVMTTFKGYAMRFSDLPPYPTPGDMYVVAEGPGAFWIWATPAGFSHPAWVDP